MLLDLEPGEMAVLVGGLITARHTLTESLVTLTPEQQEATKLGIDGIEKVLDKAEIALTKELGKKH